MMERLERIGREVWIGVMWFSLIGNGAGFCFAIAAADEKMIWLHGSFAIGALTFGVARRLRDAWRSPAPLPPRQ